MPKSDKLTLRQAKFVEAVTTPNTPTYCKPSAAYRATSPNITPESSWSASSRMLRTGKVAEAVRGQMSLGQLGSKLKRCLRESERIAKAVKEPTTKLAANREQRDTIMDYARLTGQLVDKHQEVKPISDEEHSVIRQLVSQAIAPPLPQSH